VLELLFPSGGIEVAQAPVAESWADYAVSLKLREQRLKFRVEFMNLSSDVRLWEWAEAPESLPERDGCEWRVLAAPFFSPARQERLRASGISFFDLAGNAWLAHAAVHVDRRGFPNPFGEERSSRDPYSDKASLVLRSLISSGPGRGVRAIAQEVGLSPGWVSKVVQELERRGYVARRPEGLALQHGEELLEEWVVSYRRRSNQVRSYSVAASSAQGVMDALRGSLGDLDQQCALAGHAGASLVARHAEFDVVDVYVRDAADAEVVANAAGAREVDRGANLHISVPYYRVSAFFGRRHVEGLPVVSDLQLYLDLYDYPRRGREQAEYLLEHRLRGELEAAARA